MYYHRRFLIILFLPVILTGLLSSFTHLSVNAQTPTYQPSPPPGSALTSGGAEWSIPVNLSHSGAASEPRIVAAQDGRLQVFWIDRFDGMMTALYNKEIWSLPVHTTRPTSIFIAEPQKITEMPFLFTDSSDRVNAFWYGEKDKDTDERPLFYNSLPIGTTGWTAGTMVAESAMVFNAIPLKSDEIQLAYVRTLRTEKTFPVIISITPGMYARRTTSAAKLWEPSISIESSTYYRVLDPEKVYVRLVASGNAVYMIWLEPRLNQTLYSLSTTDGVSWSTPVPLGQAGLEEKEPQLTILPNGNLLHIWQDASQSGCMLYQQELEISTIKSASAPGTPTPESTPPATATPRFMPTATPQIQFGGWGGIKQILSGLDTCPTNSRFDNHGGTLYWIWGEGTSMISLSAWDQDHSEWTQPKTFSFSFEDPETGRPVQLGNLHSVLSGDRMAVIGSDLASGEVWTTLSQLSAFDFTFAPPSPWKQPLAISDASQTASQPAVAIDLEGRTHIVWSQGAASPGSSLYYARVDYVTAPQAIEIVKGAKGEIVRQPFLLPDAKDQMHLAWSGGKTGEVYYSRALADQVGLASGWLPATRVGGAVTASWPQIAIDSSGRIFILYAVPINEHRGIYLVYSDNNGETWSSPVMIFDGQAADWEEIDHPTLTIAPDGSLHAAWSKILTASSRPTGGIYYTRTKSAFQPATKQAGTPTPEIVEQDPQWIKPIEVAPAGGDWARLAVVGDQIQLVYFAENAPSYRSLNIEQQTPEGGGWESPIRLPGWQENTDANNTSGRYDSPPFAIATDNQDLRVVAPIPGSTDLQLSQWSIVPAEHMGRWEAPEIYSSIGFWSNMDVASAMSPVSGASIAVAWLARSNLATTSTPQPAHSQIYLAVRQIPSVNVPPRTTPTEAPIPTETPATTPTTIPTATPQLDIQTTQRSLPVSPLVLGGGLAAIIVIAIFIGILVQGQNR